MKPSLVILAAGMGSRYGGLKQLDVIGLNGETIIDYSVYDALRAGFGKVVFIIKKSIEQEFRKTVMDKLNKYVPVTCVFQEIDAIPQGIQITPDRTKPWGTGHAVLMAEGTVDGPFAVINADDFYGPGAYQTLASHYHGWGPERDTDYAMVAYEIGRTLSEHGYVSRGVCHTGDQAMLHDVVERTHIERTPEGIFYQDEARQAVPLAPDTIVSMNFWGFTPSFFTFLREGFSAFIHSHALDPKAEYYIPTAVNSLIKSGKVTVNVLACDEQWYGMTYKEDRDMVVNGIRLLTKKGVYPVKLWS